MSFGRLNWSRSYMHFTLRRSTNLRPPGTIVIYLLTYLVVMGQQPNQQQLQFPMNLPSGFPIPGSRVGLAPGWKAPLLLQDTYITEAEDLKAMRDWHKSQVNGLQCALLSSPSHPSSFPSVHPTDSGLHTQSQRPGVGKLWPPGQIRPLSCLCM